ncbi:MAG TPA: methyltransferase domain-containing protein [Actinomycetota bacterium]|nr:methyltransferase domain-containing protein [Actinomycetota bacterium]
MSDVHHAAARGFDLQAGAYDRGRPGYPAQAIAFVVETLGITSGATIVDLAAGTGKLTRELVATGADLIAIEPVAGMREVLTRSLPDVRVSDGTAESLPLEDASVDGVVVAQAFHWFDGPRALAELARVLRPGGRLAVVFNVREERDRVQAALERVWEPYRGDTPTHRTGAWQQAFEPPDRFTPLVHQAFGYDQRVSADQLVDRVVSVSFIATLDEEQRVAVEAEVRTLLADEAEVVLPYRTDVFWTERR